MSNIQQQWLRDALEETRKFFTTVQEAIVTGNSALPRVDKILGMVVLSVDDLNRENELETSLHRAVCGKGEHVWNSKAVRELFRQAKDLAFDVYDRTGKLFETRLEGAIAKLRGPYPRL